ncbi:MAG: hypothetical protein ABT07_00485 [Microbacterium sp. SCN 70-10]|nr:MAG: hypothetical protein ABT07_00485 [Microbacterium sp. SCN 70-10]
MSPTIELARRAPDQRRAAVIDAARELFLAHGVTATSMDATKQHLVHAIEAEFDARILDAVKGAATIGSDAPTAASAWCTALVTAYLDQLEVHDMLFYGVGARAAERIMDATLSDSLAEVLDARGVHDPGAVASFLIGGVTALADAAILQQDDNRDALLRRVERLASAAVGVRSS